MTSNNDIESKMFIDRFNTTVKKTNNRHFQEGLNTLDLKVSKESTKYVFNFYENCEVCVTSIQYRMEVN